MAGMINVVGLFSFENQPVSHLTATLSRLAVAATRNDSDTLRTLAAIAGSFIAGAITSGIFIRDSALELGRRYGLALLAEAGIIVLAYLLLRRHNFVGLCLCCYACGLQNALMSTYSGAIIRTSHMTGIATDLGILIGHTVRGSGSDYRRLGLCVCLISGFMGGGALAALIYPRLGYATLLIPAALAAILALLYTALCHHLTARGVGAVSASPSKTS
jgi:uncharacterized membrane protein YoaK (UPF0700 family)